MPHQFFGKKPGGGETSPATHATSGTAETVATFLSAHRARKTRKTATPGASPKLHLAINPPVEGPRENGAPAPAFSERNYFWRPAHTGYPGNTELQWQFKSIAIPIPHTGYLTSTPLVVPHDLYELRF